MAEHDDIFEVQRDFAESTKALAVETGTVIDGATMRQLDDCGNLTFKGMVEISRRLGFKVAAVLHDSPAASGQVIRKSWEAAGRPHDFWELNREA